LKVLVLGSGSFAAQGLVDLLESTGLEVWTFNRGTSAQSTGRRLFGPVQELNNLKSLVGTCNVLINYILLKDADVAPNLAFCERLRDLAESLAVCRLIHISSISVIPSRSAVVDESALPDPRPRDKGRYSSIKIETESWLRANITSCQLVIIRPGFVIGPGLSDPCVGIGKLLPTKQMLALGAANGVVPVIERSQLNRALERAVRLDLPVGVCTLMLVASHSPTRREYLTFCSRAFGFGFGVIALPRSVWVAMLFGGSIILSIVQRKRQNLVRRLAHILRVRKYDCSASERALGFKFKSDWRRALLNSIDSQQINYTLPGRTWPGVNGESGPSLASNERLLYIGLGRIARDRHLPALARLRSSMEVEWWDPYGLEVKTNGGLRLFRISSLKESRATKVVVTAPAFARSGVLPDLPPNIKAILFEKPFASNAIESRNIERGLNGSKAYVLHNYRYKPNVQAMLRFLEQHGSGRLDFVRLHFDSPPVAGEAAKWMRDERRNRTLLIDYAIHFLDLAFLFSHGPMLIGQLDFTRNSRGETERIFASVAFENYPCELLIRQGCGEQKCRLEFVFQNYSCHLAFFPEVFYVTMGRQTVVDDCRIASLQAAATVKKIAEKLGMIRPEPSHQRVLAGFLGGDPSAISSVALENLRPFYEHLFQLENAIYGPA
jgi:nucleoside-diphosphate-sugar epimerase